jgi:lipopolysaccharide export system permease protein
VWTEAAVSERVEVRTVPLLARYIGRAIVGFTLLTMSVLMILFGVYLFADEQEDIGEGTYTALDALLVASLNLPGSIFALLPLGALIGALLGLANLARGSELAVMRAAGVSTARIGIWAGLTGVMLAGAAWLIGDYVAPVLQQYALQHKTFARFKEVSLLGDASAWAKDGNTFVSVQRQTTDNQFGGVYIYRFNDEHRLVSVARAAKAEAGDRWQLRDYVESRIDAHPDGDHVETERAAAREFETNRSVDFLGLAAQEPEALPGRVLFELIRHLRANELDASQYEIAFWSRIARTVAVVFFVMLAVPFAQGSSRSGSANLRVVIGVMIGVAFFLFAKTIESGAAIFDLPPLLVAWSPTLLLATITLVALARAR